MYQNTDFVTPYESIAASGTSTKNFYENTNDNEVTPSTSTLTIPPFQRKLPILPVLLIGFIQILAAAFVIILEIFVFDIGVGLWCGFVYGFAGSAALILVLVTDRERYQTSTVLMIQFVAVLVSIVELFLHVDLYRRQCLSIREQISPCQMLLMQMSGAACVLLHCCFFIIIYIHVTIVVLKQAHGTFNLSNAIRVPCQGE